MNFHLVIKGLVTMAWLMLASIAHAAVDLEINKTLDRVRATSGDSVEYTLRVTNKGDSGATGVKVTDQLPASVSYISDDEPDDQFDPVSGVWNVGAVAAGDERILKIIVIID